jgi:hypothetical protein
VIYPAVNALTRWGLAVLVLMAVGLALHWCQAIFIPVVIALLLAAMLWPFVSGLHRKVPLPWVCRRRGFPWLLPCLVWRRVPWSLHCRGAGALHGQPDRAGRAGCRGAEGLAEPE